MTVEATKRRRDEATEAREATTPGASALRRSVAPPLRRSPNRFSLTSPLVYLLLCTYLVIVVYPMFWLLYSSFKPDREIFLHPFTLPDFKHAGRAAYDKAVQEKKIDPAETTYGKFAVSQVFVNFSTAWVGGNFQRYFVNSVVITVSTVIVTTFLAAMTAYAVSRFTFPFSKPIFFYFLAGLMIPIQLAIVPLFFELKSFNML
ncbi:MAG: N-acetylglucosamine transport system permease protein, partial [Phycisphaerales bacterium]|nr:N-acetylglucosamine transport system permease protein [Phycisphaerales bacterium]